MDIFFSFIAKSSLPTLIVIAWLAVYLFITLWIFIYKHFSLNDWIGAENTNLEILIENPHILPQNKILQVITQSYQSNRLDSNILAIWKTRSLQQATKGLVILSIIASTAPFIGLFGTVVEILEAFSHLSGGGVSFDIIAPIISKALVATACGILTAIPAYSFYLLLKRKSYNLGVCIQMQINLILSAQR